MADRKTAGQVERLQLRRIGHRHAIYTPERVSKTLDVNALRAQHERQLRELDRGVKQLEQMRAAADATRALLAAFDAQSIDRVDGDPEVPLDEPKPSEPVTRAAPAVDSDRRG